MSRRTRRNKLQETLSNITGIKRAYFQPPASIQLEYPCIIYTYSDERIRHANNDVYIEEDTYEIMLITKDPLPSEMMTELRDLPYTRFSRHFVKDNLHHFSYNMHLIERT